MPKFNLKSIYSADKPYTVVEELNKFVEYIDKLEYTVLYKHELYDINTDYRFILITTSSDPIDFTKLNSYSEFWTLLQDLKIVSFYDADTLENICYDFLEHYFYRHKYEGGESDVEFDDWNLRNTTDTVTLL